MQFPRQNKHAQVGDMIIQKDKDTSLKWIGVVYDIKKDKWGHGTAFLHWSPEPPPDYNKEYGILCTNIHNLYDTYDIVKKA